MTLEQELNAYLTANGTMPQALIAACRDTFDTPSGRLLLKALCAIRHPMAHVEGMTPHQHGNCEVVALLWRYASNEPMPPPEAKPKPKATKQ